jgi:hypothetical protein
MQTSVFVEYTNMDADDWVATHDGLDGPEILVGPTVPHFSRPALGPTKPPIMLWVWGCSRGLSSRGVGLTTHPNLTLRIKKEYRYTYTSPLCLHGLF